LLRDIFANPWRPTVMDPTWLAWNAGSVLKLATAAYEEQALPEGTLDANRLAVLADAFEEAGCTDTEILGHLRSSDEYVRGCFVVDGQLGRS
jgi:hypothetical protein